MVLGQKAYMLFYLREEAGSNGSMSVVTRTQEGMIANGPQSLRCSSDHKVLTKNDAFACYVRMTYCWKNPRMLPSMCELPAKTVGNDPLLSP